MERTATCHCGALSVKTLGEPERVMMCHCASCQRRTGTSYNLGAWFPDSDVKITGEAKVYARTGDTNSLIEFHFCPNCGSNVYWRAPTIQPGKIGVAVGCFAEPEFPAPSVSLYAKHRHNWLSIPSGVPSFIGGRNSEQE